MKVGTLFILAVIFSVSPVECQELGFHPNQLVWEFQGLFSNEKSWPELMGATLEEAEDKIMLDMPTAIIQVVLPVEFVTLEFNPRHVRLYIDASGKVVRTPKTG